MIRLLPKAIKALLPCALFIFLNGCGADVTNKSNSGNLVKGQVYQLYEEVFLRKYNDSYSLHPENSMNWAPVSIAEFKKNGSNNFFLIDTLDVGTKIQFTGVRKKLDVVANQSIYNYYGRVKSGLYEGQEVIIYDLLVSNNLFNPDLAYRFFGVPRNP